MTRYEEIEPTEGHQWVERLLGKSLDDLIAMLGEPVQELGSSEWTGLSPGRPPMPIRNLCSYVFRVDGSTVKTVIAHIRETGGIGFTLQGKRLTES